MPRPPTRAARFLLMAHQLARRPVLAILAFHRVVGPAGDDPVDGVAVAELDRTIGFLKRRFSLRTLSGAVRERSHPAIGKSAGPIAVLTFDDGFRDFYELALPVLTKHDAPATLFLTTGCTGTGRLPWFVKLDALIARAGEERIAAEAAAMNAGCGAVMSLRGVETGLRTFMRKAMGTQAREQILEALWGEFMGTDEAAYARRLFLTWDEVNEIAGSGVEIGAHTVHHPDLSTLDKEEIEWEITESRRVISSRTGKQVTAFAFPWGDAASFNDDAVKVLRSAGFLAAVTSEWGLNFSLDEPFRLKRKGRRFGSNRSLWLEVNGLLDLARVVLGR